MWQNMECRTHFEDSALELPVFALFRGLRWSTRPGLEGAWWSPLRELQKKARTILTVDLKYVDYVEQGRTNSKADGRRRIRSDLKTREWLQQDSGVQTNVVLE